MYTFLYQMPKGGDLHNHTAGATYAENLIAYAAKSNFCIDAQYHVFEKQNCGTAYPLRNVRKNTKLYQNIIEAWSMQNFDTQKKFGHDHFFGVFDKFTPLTLRYSGAILAELAKRSEEQHLSYLELMVTPDDMLAVNLGAKYFLADNANVSKMAAFRKKLLATGLGKILVTAKKALNADENFMRKDLACGTAQAKAGCDIQIRYLYTPIRELPPASFFAQLLLGFELATQDPRVVGINIACPEDGKLALKYYNLQMRMINYLHQKYPSVHISLHAGELTPDLVSDKHLKNHIAQAVLIAQAERIGHGIDIQYEENMHSLLKLLANKKRLIEINLTSNANILGIKGDHHPLKSYLQNGVPTALSTDDEGVNRSNITKEFMRAALDQKLDYLQLKHMVRNSLEYAFIAGKSLWKNDQYHQFVNVCKSNINNRCRTFLSTNEKAFLQWQLEQAFNHFEHEISAKSQ